MPHSHHDFLGYCYCHFDKKHILDPKPLACGLYIPSKRLIVQQPIYLRKPYRSEDFLSAIALQEKEREREGDREGDSPVNGGFVPAPVYYYSHFLGYYDINLADTLHAIETGLADRLGCVAPYFAKPWEGSPPGGLRGATGSAREFTVFPNDTNFSPTGIQELIQRYTDGNPNRGEVRVVTDDRQQKYVFTVNHALTFCGPYDF